MRSAARHEGESAPAEPEHVPEQPAAAAAVGALQQTAGNQAVAGLMRAARAGNPTIARMFLPFFPPILLDPFLMLTTGGLSEHTAPEEITLPSELETGMKAAWDKSLPGKKSLEHGGVLVTKAGGGYAWKAGKPGTSGTFSPNYSDVKKGETLRVVAHTHPYSKKEGGHTDVSFSGGDLASFVTDPDPVQMVRSGDGIFVAARTQEFNALLTGLTKKQKDKLSAEIEAFCDGVFKTAKGTFSERSDLAAQSTCLKYHLVYYKGKAGGKLKQPEAMLTARRFKKWLDEELVPTLKSLTTL